MTMQNELSARERGRVSGAIAQAAGWQRIAGNLTYRTSDGTEMRVFASSGSWWWSAVASDSQRAKYSSPYLTERDAWKDAVHFQQSHEEFAHNHKWLFGKFHAAFPLYLNSAYS